MEITNNEIAQEITKFFKNSGDDIYFVPVNNDYAIAVLPYDNAINIKFKGETKEEIVSNFIEEVNWRLEGMIGYLEDCKNNNKQQKEGEDVDNNTRKV